MTRSGRNGPHGTDACAEPGAVTIHLRAHRLVFGLALLAGMASAATAAQAKVQTVHVIRVVDGDTVVVGTAESLNLKVRLQGIDAPECGMPFGPQAQRFLEQLVLGRTVQMAATGRDRYGRTVATLAVGGQDVGLAVLHAGLAWHDRRFVTPEQVGPPTGYLRTQFDAELNRRGLWSNSEVIPPWQWRLIRARAYQLMRRGCIPPDARAPSKAKCSAHASTETPHVTDD
jgi:endonuclease YncB( thermonuclease family)